MKKLLILSTLAAGAVAGAAVAADRYLRETWPVQVPDCLIREVTCMQDEGWTVPRWHPLSCRDRAEHTHLTSPGGLRLTIGVTGKVAIR
jgi:hypothetical protein